MTDQTVPPGLADLPLEVRQAREVENQREIAEGLTRKHLAVTADAELYAAVQLDRALRAGPNLTKRSD